MYELTVESSFSGAHQLLKSKSPCENLHGHNWKVTVAVRGAKLDPDIGWLLDFKKVKQTLERELQKYDHKFLNEVIQDSPTAENLARIIYKNIRKQLPVAKVTVWETEKASASYFE